MAFYADSGGNRQAWQAQTFLMSVVDKDSGFSFLNRRMKPIVVTVESLHHVWLCNPWTVPHQAPLSSNISQSLLKFTSVESVMPSTISSSAALFSFCPQTFPASGSFLVSQLISSDGQSIGASASATVLPINTQDWFPLGLTSLISLQSKGLWKVFSGTTIRKHQFFGAQPSLRSSCT